MTTLRPPVVGSVASLALIAALLTACGDDAAESGETVIETKLADQLGLGELDASCDEPDGTEVGSEFRCTATDPEGRTIEFLGVVTSEDEIFVSTTNLLFQDDVEQAKVEAARILSPQVGDDIDPGQIECPDDDPLFLGGPVDEGVLECTITDPAGTTYPLTITLTDYVSQVGYQNLQAQIGDPIG